ncbi:MAG TPA: oligosaccharide flippase family protein, partial [Bacteroidales bacterium]|nr:oligosaccharide flippase family protein [Bacteroidales bacterium]
QARASLWFLICSFLQKAISTLTTPIFTRLLTSAEYGQYSVYNSWKGIISVIVSMNLSYGVLMQGIVKNEGKKEEFTSSLLGLTTILVIAWCGLYYFTRHFWNSLFSLPTSQMMAMFISIWAGACFSFWSTSQRVDYKYRKMVAMTIILSIVTPIVDFIVIVSTQNKITNRIIADTVLITIIYAFLSVNIFSKGKNFFNSVYWKYALLFNLPLIPHYLSQVVLGSSDRIMIKNMVGDSEAGIYSLVYMLSTILIMLNRSINSTMEPWMYRKIRDGEAQEISSVMYPMFVMVAGINILLICFAPEVLAIFAPSSYFDAVWIIPPVAMSVFFQFTYVSFAVFEFYYKKTHYVTLATLSGALLNIGMNVVFIRFFGYYAAGYTTLFCYIVFSGMHYIFMKIIVRKYIGNENIYPLKQFLIICIIFLICGFLLLLTYHNAYIRYGVVVVGFIMAFLMRNKFKKLIKEVS